jgi:hypothetical protein
MASAAGGSISGRFKPGSRSLETTKKARSTALN